MSAKVTCSTYGDLAGAFCFRLVGVAAVDENLEGSGRSSGGGAATC